MDIWKICLADLIGSQNGLNRVFQKYYGLPDSSLLKVSWLVLSRIMQESMVLLLIFWAMISKLSMMKRMLRCQRMESMYTECTLKELNGILLSNLLMRVTPKFFSLSAQWWDSCHVNRLNLNNSKTTNAQSTRLQSVRVS